MISRITLALRFQMFKLFEWFVNSIKHVENIAPQHYIPENLPNNFKVKYLWVFASTIGELHAIQTLLNKLLESEYDALVILTDHPYYIEAFLKAYPNAIVIDHGILGSVENEIDRYLPSLFLLAEIPCVLFDAPCRFSYRVLYGLKKRQVPVVVVNGWLYNEKPSCRMDAIEYRVFRQDYLTSIDLFLVQNAEVKEQLIRFGVCSKKVSVTGNTKFDALADENPSVPLLLRPIINKIQESNRPCIVAGCITNVSEQELVLDAFVEVHNKIPSAFLIIAPRHPENGERMEILSNLLMSRKLKSVWRSTLYLNEVKEASVLVLDTIGELRHFYGASTVSYVGLNHNILEPLGYKKKVIVTGGWEKAYPSYLVYYELCKQGLITEINDVAGLVEEITSHIIEGEIKSKTDETLIKKITNLLGATEENLKHIIKLTKGPE